MIGISLALSPPRRTGTGAPPAPPFALTLNRTVYGYGSSTMGGNQDDTGVTMLTALDAAALGNATVNRGIGGTNGIDITNAIIATNVGEKAAGDFILQYAGVTGLSATAEAELANLQTAIGAAGLNGNPRWLTLAKFVDNDTGNQVGNLDWVRISKFVRYASAAWPAQAVDMQQAFRYGYMPVDANDAADQQIGRAPRSAMRTAVGDTSHASQIGYAFLANAILVPWAEGMNGGIPFVPPWRKIFSTLASAQANGGLVATIDYMSHDAAGAAQGLAGVTVGGGDADFAFVKNGDAIELRRTSASMIDEDRRFVTLTLAKGGRSREYPLIVSIGAAPGASTLPRRNRYSGGIQLRQDIAFPGLTNSGKTFSAAFDVEWTNSAFDSTVLRLLRHGFNGNTIDILRTNTGHWRVLVASDTGTIRLDMANGGGSLLHRVAQGRRWVFVTIDCDNLAASRIWLMNAAGTGVDASTYQVLPSTPPSALSLIGAASSGDIATTLISANIEAIIGTLWMSAGKVDFADPANRALFCQWDGSKAAVDLGPTGELSGSTPLPSPFIYLRGGPGDIYAGRNFAPASMDFLTGDITTGGGNAGRILPA